MVKMCATKIQTIVFVNPWRGVIGPNVGLQQLVGESLGRGHRVHIVTRYRDEFTERLERLGAKCHVMAGLELTPRSRNPLTILRHLWRGWAAAKKIGRLAREVSADVICINSENMLLTPRAGRTARCSVVVIMRGLRVGELGLAGKVYFNIQQRWVRRYVALIELGKKMLIDKGVPPEKVCVIPNGVDTDLYTPGVRDEILVSELGIAPGEPVIGTISHLTPRKGVHYLIEVLGKIKDRLPSFKSIILGGSKTPEDATYIESIHRRIEQLGLQEQVCFLGYHQDIPRLLNLFDVVVHPSETENCPRSVIEAQTCGRPIVGFSVGGMPEVIEDGQTGILIEPFETEAMAEAIVGLLKDEALRQRMGQAGRERALRLYNLKTNIAATVNVIEQAAEGV